MVLAVAQLSGMKWTVYNAAGQQANITARRSYPRGLNDRVITLVATRKSIDAAERKLNGRAVRVRIGTSYPIQTEPVEIQEGS